MKRRYPLFVTKYFKGKRKDYVIDVADDREILEFCGYHLCEGEVVLRNNNLFISAFV